MGERRDIGVMTLELFSFIVRYCFFMRVLVLSLIWVACVGVVVVFWDSRKGG